MSALKSTEQCRASAEQAIGLLGETCFDVYLSDVAYWRCVPVNVWRYYVRRIDEDFFAEE